jgi:hypothetical protein
MERIPSLGFQEKIMLFQELKNGSHNTPLKEGSQKVEIERLLK